MPWWSRAHLGNTPGHGSSGSVATNKLPRMPAVNKHSTLAIKAALKAGPGAGKAKRISGGDGLVLEVRPGGVGWWRLRYFFQATNGC